MTHFMLHSNFQETHTENSEVAVFSIFCNYYKWSQGSKPHSFPSKLVNNTEICSISFCFVSILLESLEETVLVRHLWVAVVGPYLLSFICSRWTTIDVSFLYHSKGHSLSTRHSWKWYQTSSLTQMTSIVSIMPWFTVQAFPELQLCSQCLSLMIDLPFTFLSILSLCILALKLTDFLIPVTKIRILCSIACKSSSLQTSAPLDKFARTPFPKCQLSQGIFTWTGPRKVE